MQIKPGQHGLPQPDIDPLKQDVAAIASGATNDEIIGRATTEAKPTFQITSLLVNPAK